MNERALKQLDNYRIVDEKDQTIYYGCDQEWYSTKWKQMAGCGPTAASNLILYNTLRDIAVEPLHIQSCRHLMNAVWKYITPGMGGVNTTLKFLGGLNRYIKDHELPYTTHVLDIPKLKAQRPTLQQLIAFLDKALSEDLPVAFLNLHNGDTKELDEWHWVTIVAISFPDDHSTLSAKIMDAGKLFDLNLGLWLETTQNKGGFICMPVLQVQS